MDATTATYRLDLTAHDPVIGRDGLTCLKCNRRHYVEPTRAQLEAAYLTAQRLIREREGAQVMLTKVETKRHSLPPSPGWNFGSGTTGVVE